jgi:hypothetical protein
MKFTQKYILTSIFCVILSLNDIKSISKLVICTIEIHIKNWVKNCFKPASDGSYIYFGKIFLVPLYQKGAIVVKMFVSQPWG